MTVTAQYHDHETEEAKWNSAIINLIMHTCAFPRVTWQSVFREKGLFSLTKERHVASDTLSHVSSIILIRVHK